MNFPFKNERTMTDRVIVKFSAFFPFKKKRERRKKNTSHQTIEIQVN